MSSEDSGHVTPPPVEPLAQPPARALVDDEFDVVRHPFVDQDDDMDARIAAAVAAAMAQQQVAITALTAQNAALARENQQVRRDATEAARERARSRFSALHTPLVASRLAPQSSPTTLITTAEI
jgi:hypothetical protein